MKSAKYFAVVLLLLVAGCGAPTESIEEQEEEVPPYYVCPDGTVVTDPLLCAKECAGAAEPYCEGNLLMHNAECIEGEWVYRTTECEYGCMQGECLAEPVNCDDGNECTIDAFVEGGCTYVQVEDGTPCGEEGECIGGMCYVHVVAEPEPASQEALKKLRACTGSFTRTYWYKESDGQERHLYFELKRSHRSDGSGFVHAMFTELGQVAPTYTSVKVSDFLYKNCECGSRELSIEYKGSKKGGGAVIRGGTCGVAPEGIPPYVFFYSLIDENQVVYRGQTEVAFPAYVGPAEEYYQSVEMGDGSIVNMRLWLANMMKIPVKVVGNSTKADGSGFVEFEVVLQP